MTLTGEVTHDFQRRAADRIVRSLRGIVSVVNQLTLSARLPAVLIEERIISAFHRDNQLDPRHIVVTVIGNQVILTGTVRTGAEKRQASFARWCAPAISTVTNRITISP